MTKNQSPNLFLPYPLSTYIDRVVQTVAD